MAADRASRRAAYRLGRWAEGLAAALLVGKGFTILARRYGGKGGEIDLVARRGRVLVFVEVKARGDLDVAALSITGEKRRLFARAARHYVARHPWAAGLTLRCDAVFLAPWRWPRHVPDAFPLEE
jgi:putative endonuclease